MKNVKDINSSVESINERIIAGRYIIHGTNMILQTFFPIFEDSFIERQVNNSICVIEKMTYICKS